MTISLRARRELIEEIDEVLRGTLTCPVCQSTLVQDTRNPHNFICIHEPCIYIDFIISSPHLDELISESPLPDERPADTSWRKVPAEKPEPYGSNPYRLKPKRKPPTSFGTKDGINSTEALLSLIVMLGIVMGILFHIH